MLDAYKKERLCLIVFTLDLLCSVINILAKFVILDN